MTSKGGRRAGAVVGAAALIAVLAGLAARGEGPRPGERLQATLAVAEALGGGDPSGFARAERPRPFAFPDDHGPHPEYRTEWWYYTANLTAQDGRHFGVQVTFFRSALVPEPPARASAWSTAQVYLAHFAVTDTRAGRFLAESRTERGALDLAGATARPFRVWVDDWAVAGEGPSGLPMRLRAQGEDAAVDLVLEASKPPVLHGDHGLSVKGSRPGNASFYYSLTRMPARGIVRVGTEQVAVQGLAWMDREWSTSALDGDLVGWDWFALQLDDGRDLMFYQLRRRDGTAAPWSAGTLVDPRGNARPLGAGEVRVEVLGSWTSARSGVRYPSGWRVSVPSADLAAELAPRLRDQELRVGTRYWEGAVAVRGSAGGRPLGGNGYAELVGYGE